MKLTMAQRKKLPLSDFAVPSKAPGPGSYPEPDASHARNALSRSSQFGGAATKAAVKAKTRKKYPGIKVAGPSSG
jgi:hypothetical protein